MSTGAGVALSSNFSYIVADNLVTSFSNAARYFLIDNGEVSYSADLSTLDGMCYASSGGSETGIHRSNVVTDVTITLPEDNPSTMETSSLTQNNAYDLYIRRGNVATSTVRFDIIKGAIFRFIRKAATPFNGRARRVHVVFEKGQYTSLQPTTSPLTGYLVTLGREAS